MLRIANDPAIVHLLNFALAGILLTGAIAKLRDPQAFRALVADYRLLPEVLSAPVAALIMVAEAAAGVGLLVPAARPWAQIGALVLLGAVTSGVVVNLWRGRSELSCGCGGVSGDQSLSWALVARNVALAGAAWAATAAPAARALHLVDHLAVVLGALALVGLYGAANELIANRPRIAAVGR